MTIRRIGVLGAGTMGSGICQTFCMHGYDVTLVDVAQAAIDRAVKGIGDGLERLVKKDKMSAEQKSSALERISTGIDLALLKDCDVVVEAALEQLDLKLDVFRKLDAIVKPEGILASNTSSISITRIAAATSRPAQVVGLHFFNPVPVMALVEVIRGLQTSDATVAAMEEIVATIGKSSVQVRNSPGFVVNRLLIPMINEAIFALGEGIASAEQIDAAMKLGANHPIGPLALCDMIGLDIQLAVMQVLYESFKDPKYRPAPLLVEMVAAGHLGRKAGKGFYTY